MTPLAEEPESVPWWRSAAVYQIWPRSFADASNDGIGDIAGIRTRLDHLSTLGVDAMWLSPMYASPQDDAGYDVSDYRRIDPTFGTIDEFDRLVADAHARGIKVIMDLVVNHTSHEHEWFQASRSSTGAAKRDWYWWRPARAGMQPGDPGAEPTNWGSVFGGSAWELDDRTGEYYLHLFSTTQPDLNWENIEVRAAIHSMMRWWLDRGVDGFRMDVINFVSKDPALPDGVVGTGSPYGDAMPHVADGPRVHEFLQEMHREVFAGRDGLIVIGEMPGVTVQEARRYTDPRRHELDMVFQFEHVQVDHGPGGRFDTLPLRLADLKAVLGRWQVGLADVGWNSLYWSNHDQPRVVSRFGDDGEHRTASAKALAILLHLHRGTPFVYQGEELGMANYPFTSVDELRDIQSLNHVRSAIASGLSEDAALAAARHGARDNARTPVQWDAGEHAGFTRGEPWMAVNPDHTEVNAAAQIEDPDSVFHLYRRLIELRHDLPVVAHGDFTMLAAQHEQVYCFTRRFERDELLVMVNVSGEVAQLELPDSEKWLDAELLLANMGELSPISSGLMHLRPWEARVYRRACSP